MATREEIIEALERIGRRLDEMAPRIRSGFSRPLTSGTWTVRDALCHLAADANGVPGFLERVQRVKAGLPRRQPGFDVDDYNQKNIEARKDKSLEELIAEIKEGIRADCERIRALDEETLQLVMTDVRGRPSPVSDQMRGYLGGHPMRHLDDIEEALSAAV